MSKNQSAVIEGVIFRFDDGNGDIGGDTNLVAKECKALGLNRDRWGRFEVPRPQREALRDKILPLLGTRYAAPIESEWVKVELNDYGKPNGLERWETRYKGDRLVFIFWENSIVFSAENITLSRVNYYANGQFEYADPHPYPHNAAGWNYKRGYTHAAGKIGNDGWSDAAEVEFNREVGGRLAHLLQIHPEIVEAGRQMTLSSKRRNLLDKIADHEKEIARLKVELAALN